MEICPSGSWLWNGLPLFTELPRRVLLGNSKSIRAKGKPVGHVLLAFKAISYL
jgi:hypothetical protein